MDKKSNLRLQVDLNHLVAESAEATNNDLVYGLCTDQTVTFTCLLSNLWDEQLLCDSSWPLDYEWQDREITFCPEKCNSLLSIECHPPILWDIFDLVV